MRHERADVRRAGVGDPAHHGGQRRSLPGALEGRVAAVHYKTCATRKLADSFRSALNAAAHAGEPFDPQSGLPRRMQPKAAGPTWFDHAQAFTDMKWPAWSPRHRQSTAEGLTTITLALVEQDKAPAAPELVRSALRLWAFNPGARAGAATPPEQFVEPLAWVARHSRPLQRPGRPDHAASRPGRHRDQPRRLDRVGIDRQPQTSSAIQLPWSTRSR